jgi:predicted regulator of Ras-like GTPase activity (Roadblock/LC7/MglB family)
MAMHGSLKDMSVADIIQHNCQDQKTALLMVDNGIKKAQMYFRGGAVVHAIMDNIVGEEVVFQTLTWPDGKFILEMGTPSPAITIRRSWSSLLLEGAKLLDEHQADEQLSDGMATPLSNKDEMVNEILIGFLAASKVFKGVAVSDINGAIRAMHTDDAWEKELVGSVAAAMYSFGRRSLSLANQGKFLSMAIQGATGCIWISIMNPTTLFYGMAPNRPDLQKATEEINRLRMSLFDYL